MSTLSAVLIVKNETDNLASCLERLAFADEIIVLDANSSDNTVEIAKQYTDKVFVERDWQGFGKQRQRAQKHAKSEWVLMIDADELLSDELKLSIQNAVTKNQQNNVYALSRLSRCFGGEIRHSGWYPDWVIRLYAKKNADWDDALVHEKLVHQQKVVKLSGDLQHNTYQSLHHYLIKSANYARDWAQQNAQRKTSLSRAIAHGVACFIKMYLLKLGFLDGKPGLLLALLSAHSTFSKHATLWLKHRAAK